jgi:hypothetical protein
MLSRILLSCIAMTIFSTVLAQNNIFQTSNLRSPEALAQLSDVDFFGGCVAGTMDEEGPIFVCPNNFFLLSSTGAIWPVGGGYGWNFTPGADGGGGLPDGFSVTQFDNTQWLINDDVNGIMSGNGLGVLTGTWIIQGYSYTDGADAPGTACELTANSLTVVFLAGDPACDGCEAGEFVDLTPQVVPDGQVAIFATAGELLPAVGGYAYYFEEGVDGTGGLAGGFSIINSSPLEQFDNDLNGILSDNALPVLEGEWLVQPYVYTDDTDALNTACDFADGILSVYWGDDQCTSITNGTSPYAASDPIFLEVIAADSYCCDVEWDGTCEASYQDIFNGCTYSNATNFDPLAQDDDGTCLFACFGDSNNDGIISTADLLEFLVVFGGTCD